MAIAVLFVLGVTGTRSAEAATGQATVIGHTETVPVLPPFTPYDTLVSMEFVAEGAADNDVTFLAADYLPEVLECDSPTGLILGGCYVYTYPSRYLFADASGDLTSAEGACHLIRRGLAQCYSPSGRYLRFAYYDLPVRVVLGDGDDRFQATGVGASLPFGPGQRETYLFDIVAGSGDDVVVLADRTQWSVDPLEVDRVSCGPGDDTVVVLPGTQVAPDCERVVSIPVGNQFPP